MNQIGLIIAESIILVLLVSIILQQRKKNIKRKKESIEQQIKEMQENTAEKLIDLVDKHMYFRSYYDDDNLQKMVQDIETEAYRYIEQYQEKLDQYKQLEKLYEEKEISKREFISQSIYIREDFEFFLEDIIDFEKEIIKADVSIQPMVKIIGLVQQRLKELESSYLEFEDKISLDLFMYENKKNQLHSRFKCIISLSQKDPMQCKILLMELDAEISDLLSKLPIIGRYYQVLEELKTQKVDLKQKIKKNEEIGWDFSMYSFGERLAEINECQQYSLNSLKRGNINEIGRALNHGKQILEHIEKQMNNHMRMGYEIERKVTNLEQQLNTIQSSIYKMTEIDIKNISVKYDIDAAAHFEKYIEWIISYQHELDGIKNTCESQEFNKALSALLEMEQKVLEIKTKSSLLTLQSLEYNLDEIKNQIKILHDQLEADKDLLKYYQIHQHDNEIRAYQRELTGLLSYMHQEPIDFPGVHSAFKRVCEQIIHVHKKVFRVSHAYETVTYFLPFLEQKIYEIKKNSSLDIMGDEQNLQENYRKTIELIISGDYIHARESMKELEVALEKISA